MSSSFSANQRGCPWPSFKGTWDLPKHIPPVNVNPTARSQEGQQQLRAWGQVPAATSNVTETKETNRYRRSSFKELEENPVGTPAADGPELQRPISQASQQQSRPATQQSQTQSQPASTQTQTKSRPPSQADQA
ncbi:Protein Flattop [Bagarius yarrelli]|uniref:Protein Flattop n=1 Tax=Bagarius yarrelli TaxID=175774 RepID=A0A556U2E3_BAGYA|nr:Protein Flattop [Bagarius yarrelli]